MKTIILSILTSAAAFAVPHFPPSGAIPADFEPPVDLYLQESPSTKEGFYYFRFSTAEGDLSKIQTPYPGLGIGYRRLASNGALDLSIGGIGYGESKNEEFFWTFPKASYIHYLTPAEIKSIYVGGGIAWGGIKRKNQKFVGLIPSFIIGTEFLRKSAVLGFAEISISQPAVAVRMKGEHPGLIGEISIGAGF